MKKRTKAVEPVDLCFTQLEIARYELARTEHELALCRRALKQSELEKDRLQHELLCLRKQQELVRLGFAVGETVGKLDRLNTELGKKYKLDMTKVAYDNITGKVTILE